MSKNIALIEFVDEARSFLDFCKADGIDLKDITIVALQAEVQIYLKSIGVTYENTLSYFSNEAHARALIKSEEWCQLIKKHLNLIDGNDINETYNNSYLFYIRFYMNHFLTYVEILNELSVKHDINSFYACRYKNAIHDNVPPIIQDDERFLGLIVEKFAQEHNINFHEIPVKSISRVVGNVKSYRTGGGTFGNISNRVYRYLFNKHLNSKNLILLTSAGYNLGKFSSRIKDEIPEANWVVLRNDNPSGCVKELIGYKVSKILNSIRLFKNRKDYFFDFKSVSMDVFQPQIQFNSASSTQLDKSINKSAEILKNEMHDSFSYNQINFLDVFIEKIEKDLKPYILHLHLESEILKNIIENHNIKLVISPFARGTSLMLGELCTNIGIPCLMISHGTTTSARNKLEEIENYHIGESLILSEYYKNTAIQSPSELKHLQYYNCKNNVIITGPLIFSKSNPELKEQLKNKILGKDLTDKKILLYPENIRGRHNYRFHVFETLDEFLSSSINLVDAVNKINNAHLIIRLHPGRKFTPDEFRSLLPESDNFTVMSSEQPLSDMLSITDLLINFSSTVIEDALQNHIPVLLYDRRKRYMHFKAQELGRRKNLMLNGVYYISDHSYLEEGLQWIVNNHLNKKASISDSIFDEYVFQKDNFNNVVTFISEAINK